jgi:transposase
MTNTASQLLPAVDLQQLPNDPPTLKGLVVELTQALRDEQQQAARWREQLERLLRRLYGRRSERLDPSQQTLFAAEPTAAASPPDTPASEPRSRGGRTPHGRQRLPAHLPRQEIRYELAEAVRACPCCGQVRVALSEEVSEQLEYVPASVLVRRHVRVKYVCRRCEHQRQHPQTTTCQSASAPSCTADNTATTPATATVVTTEVADSGTAVGCCGDDPMTQLVDTTPAPEPGRVAVPASAEPLAVLVGPAPVGGALLLPAQTVVSALPDTVTSDAQSTAVPVPAAGAAATLPPSVGPDASPRSTIVTAAMPPQPIPRCLAGPGLLAHVIVNKFADHLPLYRQEQQFLRQGVWLSRRTLCDWLAGCARVLQPLFALMWQRVFAGRALHTDDTPVCVQGQRSKGHLWVYVGDSAHPYTVYDFTPDRSGQRPQECLSSFRGYLHADGYSVYDKVFGPERIEVGCWAHARRYFHEARDTDPVRACCMLALIGELYAWEAAAKYAAQVRELREADYWEVRYQLRRTRAVPLLSRLQTYAEQQRAVVLPRSPIGEAFTYLSNQWDALQRYLEHGYLDIDNNVGEQALRAIGIGRKNWLFLGSEEGGRTAATLYSMVQTCKRHGLDPWFYLREVLTILPTLTEQTRATELPKLLPDEWARSQRQSHGGAAPPASTE